MDRYCKRLIEVDLPVRRISAHALEERNSRTGHISNLHIWWARRPLASCRAVICAALWPDPADQLCPALFQGTARDLMLVWAREHLSLLSPESYTRFHSIQRRPSRLDTDEELRAALLDFIADFAASGNATRPEFLQTARLLTEAAHNSLGGADGTFPIVVDPFAGGGAIPVEALRVGAESFGFDLNPVAHLLTKVAIVHVPEFADRLVARVEKWGEWVQRRMDERLGSAYPAKPGESVLAYLWARTIRCEGPRCGLEVPIILNPVLSKKAGHEAAVTISYCKGKLVTKVEYGAPPLEAAVGTNRRSSVTCPACGHTTKRNHVEAQALRVGFGYKLLAICYRKAGKTRYYRDPTDEDLRLIQEASRELSEIREEEVGGIPIVPAEELPYLRSIFNVRVYGIDRWYKLFHTRQLLSAVLLVRILRECAREVGKVESDPALAKATVDCLALSVSNSLQYQCNITTYPSERAGFISAFIQGQSLPMKMDFVEVNPLVRDLAGGYAFTLAQHLSGLRHLASSSLKAGTVARSSALETVLPNDSCECLVTDPPYYDYIPFANCSDFFYVWLRRMLVGISDFDGRGDLTPKKEEIVQLAERNIKYKEKTKQWFEDSMRGALERMRLAVKPSGIGVVLFAHKETAAWEALLGSLLDAGWVVTGSWPIQTENANRMRASGSAVLNSTVHLVCRPRERSDGSLEEERVGDWREVLEELPIRIRAWLPRLAEEGIVGADAIFACLGPALEIYSQFSSVEKASGKKVTLREYLEEVWAAVSREALSMIFDGADALGFEEDARLTAMWLWTLHTSSNGDDGESDEKAKSLRGYSLEYDAARKIAQGLGAHLENLGDLVEVKGDTATLLSTGARTRYLFGKDAAEPPRGGKAKKSQMALDFAEEVRELETEYGDWADDLSARPGSTTLDQLHQSMILFGAGRGEALRRFLVEDGVGRNPLFWRLAQAFSSLYPSVTEEKRWVDGVLGRKKGLGL